MPRKLRVPKARRGPLAVAELAARARWGGVRLFWDRVDRVHGCGGEIVLERPRRPDDDDTGDSWFLSRFHDALDEDRREVERVVADHPGQADRLRQWLADMEALGCERNCQPDLRVSYFYEQLSELGYSGHSTGV